MILSIIFLLGVLMPPITSPVGTDITHPTVMTSMAPTTCHTNVITNDLATGYYPDYRPYEEFNLMVRHMGPDSRAGFVSGCGQVSTFMNSREWMDFPIPGGGPHVNYEYLFDEADLPPAFVGDSHLVLQGYAELPWVHVEGQAVGQIGFMLNLEDSTSGRRFTYVVNVYDNRWSEYQHFIWHDGWRPFLSTAVVNSEYLTVSPYSSSTSSTPWTGWRFYRVHITGEQLAAAVGTVNAYCRQNLTSYGCDEEMSLDPHDWRVVRFGLGQEVIPGSGEITMASRMGWVELYRAEV